MSFLIAYFRMYCVAKIKLLGNKREGLKMQKDKDPTVTKTLIQKMAFERTESYIAAAHAIIHLHGDGLDHDSALKNLSHVLNLMSMEIKGLGTMLDNEMSAILANCTASAANGESDKAAHH